MNEVSLTREQAERTISEIVKKQMTILGSEVAYRQANSVAGLTVQRNGEAKITSREPVAVIEALTASYVELIGPVVRNTIDPILKRSNISLNELE
jgi:hypothetical protein